MEIRPFRPADAADLTTLLHRAYAELGDRGLNFTAVDQDEETTLRRASAGASWVLVDGDRTVATMTISWPAEQTVRDLTPEARIPARAWLNQLAVDPDYRSQGLAQRLRDTGYAWCVDQGATSIGLDTAEPAGHLVELYARWGFTTVDKVQWPGKRYRSLIMKRGLAPIDVR
ncbi:GNAT family N-acetyltransferase [Agrococcus sp. Marseille-Q4369]|uniref:GNAT family N-acetyltransferase n=1 Tax=Agrococcus sp. Marseille-Q4369 TaxID=2810513 RepID=UPI001B8AA3F4|nr:GNAT family N-acetyltransferase [Agrococcus sp. Marseille-Q4369]QUW18183.1 GNAT family N-acetyltransferase [Agrococcus sp. Marseille-Q4369]